MKDERDESLEFTPTWVVAVVCALIIGISLLVERALHYIGQLLMSKNQKPLYEALQKVKEELMLLGFISLLLTVFQGAISKVCIPARFVTHMLPCSLSDEKKEPDVTSTTNLLSRLHRWLLETEVLGRHYCAKKHLVPFLSVEALHHLHIFIFVLAVVHVTSCVLIILFGGVRIDQWKYWEDPITEQNRQRDQYVLQYTVTNVHETDFIKNHFKSIGENSTIKGWMRSFFKQFYASVTKADYLTLRMGFIMTHCRGNQKFNFHKYMIRALEDDFKHVVGISWYLWLFAIIFLLLNVNGWHAYFWISFIPFILLLAVGTKLEHVIAELAYEVAEKHAAIVGDLIVKPSDEHFWFHRPQIALFLIHFILFQNAFEIAYFFWIWVQYGFGSCIMGRIRYILPRLIIGVFIQVLCSYSTLPLYAIVTQMGSSYKKAIFDEHIQAGILGWRQMAKRKKGLKKQANTSKQPGPSDNNDDNTDGIQLGIVTGKQKEDDEIQVITT